MYAYAYGGEFKPTQTFGMELKSVNSFHEKTVNSCIH